MDRSHTDSNEQFGSLFLDLPLEIIEKICQQLPLEIICDVLMKVPLIRPLLLKKYHKYIELYLVTPFGPDRRQDHAVFLGFDNIQNFLTANWDIVPKEYIIHTDHTFTGLQHVLRTFRDTLEQAESLKIHYPVDYPDMGPVQKYPSKELMGLIFSFRNIDQFRAWYHKGHFDSLPNMGSLRKFTLDALGTIDWWRISLPPTLEEFELCRWGDPVWLRGPYLNFRVESISLESLFHLLWRKSPSNLQTSDTLCCPHLSLLTLKSCGLDTLDLSFFPPTLVSLLVFWNPIKRIKHSGRSPYWPENLKQLVLYQNAMTDSTVNELSNIRWPRRLEFLSLFGNRIQSLECLYNLPNTLVILILSGHRHLTNLNVVHRGYGYRIANLPASLERLELEECREITWRNIGEEASPLSRQRVHFPPKLKQLNLRRCNLNTLAHLAFPSTLEVLDLSRNQLKSLQTYNSAHRASDHLGWENLVKLHTLCIDNNNISTLKGWTSPRLLRDLKEQFEETGSLSPLTYIYD